MAIPEASTVESAVPSSRARVKLAAPDLSRRAAACVLALVILALSVFFHTFRLSQTPGWDPQEGYNLDLAWNLAHGHQRLFALSSAFAQHPPLFYLQLALAIRLFGYGIVTVRALAAAYAVLTCAALLTVGRRILGTGPALWAGIVYTVAPIALANTRWGYSYALLAFVGVLCLGAAWRYRETGARRWLLLAAALAGLATFSDYEGIAWIAFVTLVAWQRSRRDALLSIGVGLGILCIGLLACLLAAPAAFAADFSATFGRVAGGNPLVQLIALLVSYYHFLALDSWLLLGVVGLFLAPSRVRGFLLSATLLLAFVVLNVRPVSPSFHAAVPLLPLLALGAGAALDLALRHLYAWCLIWLAASDTHVQNQPAYSSHRDSLSPRRVRESRGEASWGQGARQLLATLAVFVVVVAPIAIAYASDTAELASSLRTQQDTLLALPSAAQATTRYVLAYAHPGDLVLASPDIAWLFDHPASAPNLESADLLQTLAQQGQAAAFYPAHLPASRWLYNVSLSRARFVVVDSLLRRLATPDQLPTLVPILAQVEHWPVAFTSSQYTVYERPGSA